MAIAVIAVNAYAEDPLENAVAHLGVGAGISFTHPSSSDGKPSDGLAIAYRWHSFHSGWGPTFGLDFHSNDFNHPIGPVSAPIGPLRMRSVLAGFGHTRRFGRRFTTSASVSAGYSFNDLSIDGGAGPAFAAAGMRLVGASVNDSWVVRPDVAAWYDIGRHIGIGVSAAYFVSRPDETITTNAGSSVRRLHADAFEVTTGITFGIWRKKQP
jgi:hypothetical protein